MTDKIHHLSAIQTNIARMCAIAGRAGDAVQLVAVSKTHGAEAIMPLLEAGQRVFGENRVQEAQGKWPALKAEFPDIELHLIGPLQSNKAADAVALFDVIETLDRDSLVAALAKEMHKQNKHPKLFVQVNTGEEPQKAGLPPRDVAAFVELCRTNYGLSIEGLMCIPPAEQLAAPHFALLQKMAGELGLPLLSMGMSADYEQAIMLGATHVRVGSALFGARN